MREFVLLLFILPFCFAQCAQYDSVSVQLRWYHQSEFAGYYAAIDKGYYIQQCLNVSINQGSSNISVGDVLNSENASIGVDLLGNLFKYRQSGKNVTNVAQIFTRSSSLLLSFENDMIQTPLDLANKRIGYYNNSQLPNLQFLLNQHNLTDNVTLVLVNSLYDYGTFFSRSLDAILIDSYDQLGRVSKILFSMLTKQLLQTVNSATGRLYTMSDFNVIYLNDESSASLEDGILVSDAWLASTQNQAILERFLIATFQGWLYCRDNEANCVNFVRTRSSSSSIQEVYMMREVNKLVWPSKFGIGIMSFASFNLSEQINQVSGLSTAFQTQYAYNAIFTLIQSGVDISGGSYSSDSLNFCQDFNGNISILLSYDVQLYWYHQALFGGYYAAKDLGYYTQECLLINFIEGGSSVDAESQVVSGDAHIGIDWLSSLLDKREAASNSIVNVAQIFTRSAMRLVSFKSKSISSASDLKNKTIGTWSSSVANYNLLSLLKKYKYNVGTDLKIVYTSSAVTGLLNGTFDVIAVMTHTELAQLLQSMNSDTDKLYSIDDLNIIDLNNEGTAMLEDGVFVTSQFLQDSLNQNGLTRFLRASLKGWMYCRDNEVDCVQYVHSRSPNVSSTDQLWRMHEVNKLIWPSPTGLSVMNPSSYSNTVQLGLSSGLIHYNPGTAPIVETYAVLALDTLRNDYDTFGNSFVSSYLHLCINSRNQLKMKANATLLLSDKHRAQFAGYYAAANQGYFSDECLNLVINELSNSSIVPEVEVMNSRSTFAISHLSSLLYYQDLDTQPNVTTTNDIINIAQIFVRTASRQISLSSKYSSFASLKHKNVGYSNKSDSHYSLLALLQKYNLSTEVNLEDQSNRDYVSALLSDSLSSISVESFNEIGQLLQTKVEPAISGAPGLYVLENFTIFDFNSEGVAMLQDGIIANKWWLEDVTSQDITVRFLRGVTRGWAYCRDNEEDCVNNVLSLNPSLSSNQQHWEMREVNKLVWPSPHGIGYMNDAAFWVTANISKEFGLVKKSVVSSNAYTLAYVQEAVFALEETTDVRGKCYNKSSLYYCLGKKDAISICEPAVPTPSTPGYITLTVNEGLAGGVVAGIVILVITVVALSVALAYAKRKNLANVWYAWQPRKETGGNFSNFVNADFGMSTISSPRNENKFVNLE